MKKSETTILNTCMLLVMLLLSRTARAQRFVNTSLDGAQTVCAITQDAQGVMWLGTENGLYSYDGYHGYRHYDDHSFSNTRVNALATEGNKLLYLATGNGMLLFNMQANRYETTSSSRAFGDETKRKTLREQRAIDLKNKPSIYGSDVYTLLHTSAGLLMGKLSGLYLGKRLLPLAAGNQPLVNALAYDTKRHCYWIGTEGALYCADLQLQTFSKITALDGNSIKCLSLDENGNLYIGTDNGLYEMAMNSAISHYTHDSSDVSSIPNNIVWACFVDKWQNVWIGTDNGLSRLSTFNYYQYVSLDKITLSGEGNCLHDILQTRNGEWWMGGTNGLIHFSSTGGFSQGAIYAGVAWYKQNNAACPLSHNRVRKIYEDREGDVWICTDHGVNLYDRLSGQMQNFNVYDKTGKYSTAWAYDILEDQKGRLWIASYMGGIFVVGKQRLLSEMRNAKKETLKPMMGIVADFHFSDHGHTALSGLHVGQMVIDGKGMIWASTYNRLDRIDPVSMKVQHVAGADIINYLMVDGKGNVWVGDNRGVKSYQVSEPMKNGEFSVREWNIGGKVSTMADVAGKVWAVSGKECSVLSADSKSIRFAIPEITPLTIFYSSASHRVLMGGNDGFVSIDEDIANPRVRPMSLLLTGVVVNGKLLSELDRTKLTLASDENNFTLQLCDLPFANHPSDVYAYQLEGSDHDWQYLQNGNIDISYNGLSYGDYHLTVHVVTGEGKIGDEVYSLDICILPPWYLSIWAKLLYLIALVALVAWVMRFYFLRKRLAEEQRQKAEILEQVDARMNFFNRLAEGLKTAVAHRSFDEINELVARLLDVDATPVELPAVQASDQQPETPVAEDNIKQETKPEKPKLDEADERLLQEINQAVEQHMIDSDFNVTMLQEVLGMGGKQLYRKVKMLTGHTPVEYIREMRLRKAAKLLSAGKFSVSEVMYTVGFSNSSYFSKCFSKAFGMTPTEYMKMGWK